MNYGKLKQIVSETIKDGRVVSLIHKYLNASAMVKGVFERNERGFSQGGLCQAPHNSPYAEIVIMPS